LYTIGNMKDPLIPFTFMTVEGPVVCFGIRFSQQFEKNIAG
jgi:hypothetical protein